MPKTSTSQPKKLYRVTLNWQREVHTFYRRATSASKAAQIAYLALAEKLGFHNEGLAVKYLKINGKWEDHIHMVLLNEKLEREDRL